MKRANNLSEIVEKDPELRFLPELIKYAVGIFAPDSIALFGSRARGDARPKSDVDLAFWFDEKDRAGWNRFAVSASEDLPTLLSLDLLDMNTADTGIRESVEREGVLIYESQKN